MSVRGIVKNGVVVPEEGIELPDGATVTITSEAGGEPADSATPSLAEAMKEFIGMGNGMPKDGSKNIDYYLYGAPRK
jgi:hypothetical protein